MRVDVVERLGPGAELLAVVGEDDRRPRPLVGEPPEVLIGRVRLLERDQVAEPLRAREDLEQPALVLGEVVAEEVVVGQPGALEVEVVEDGVLDPRLGQGRDQVLLPDPLGDPHPADLARRRAPSR